MRPKWPRGGRTDRRMDISKFPCVLQVIGPLGPLPKKADLRLKRPDQMPVRADLKPKMADLRPKRSGLRPGRANFRKGTKNGK